MNISEVREALGRSPDVGDPFLMRMYFRPILHSAGQTDERSVRYLNMHGRGFGQKFNQRGV